MRRLLEGIQTGVGLVFTGIVILAITAVVVGSHDACVSRSSGEVRYGDWGVDPLDWFAVTTISDQEICEGETGAMWIAGKIPVIGETLERAMGGPSNPAYYENK